MPQTVYNSEPAAALLGALGDISLKHVDSMIASEAIPVARGVAKVPGTNDRVRLTNANYATAAVASDLAASHSTIVTVNGTATTATVYDGSSHATTMAAIVVKVLALATVANAWLDTSDNKIIHIVGLAGTAVTVTVATTLGSNPPAWTITASFRASDLIGFALLSQRLEGVLPDNDNVAVYPINSLVNVLRKGRIWVNFETTFNPEKDTLYVRYTATTGKYVGDFLNSADTARAVSLSGLPIRVLTKMTAPGIGLIEVNLP